MDLSRLLRFVSTYLPFAHGTLSRYVVDYYARRTDPRPRPFSLWAPAGTRPDYILDYTSWPGLTDRTYSARHLGPAKDEYVNWLNENASDAATDPQLGAITQLFDRAGQFKPGKSSMLFAFFAQWFTDSFLRVDSKDRRMNTSNHDIDLCQIYGLSESAAHALRSKAGGKLRSQVINGQEYPEYLFERCAEEAAIIVDSTGGHWRPCGPFAGLFSRENFERVFKGMPADRLAKMYATGTEMGNSSVAYVGLSTLFLREHNRICGVLARHNDWDDERLFQTARMINIAMLIQLVLNEYINHVTGFPLFRFQTGFADKRPWYRSNWISIEFDLLYRWHSMVVDQLSIAGRSYPVDEIRNNNQLLEDVGLAAVFEAATQSRAGRIGLRNTPSFLMRAEAIAIKMGRDSKLRTYNDYRERFGLPRLTSFEQLSDDQALCDRLRKIYGDIDKLEYLVGIFAEEPRGETITGELMTCMVAYDAFTHIFTNPLLAEHVYSETTFTKEGLAIIENTTLQKLVDRNMGSKVRVSFEAAGEVVQLPVERQRDPGPQADAAQ